MARFLILYLAGVNLLAFFLMRYDKKKAVNREYRVPESTLLLAAFAGGSLGELVGMKIFHHKTQKAKFYISVPLMLLAQAAVLVCFFFLK